MKTIEEKITQALCTPNGELPSNLIVQLADLLQHKKDIDDGRTYDRGAYTRNCRRFVSRLQKHIDKLDNQ